MSIFEENLLYQNATNQLVNLGVLKDAKEDAKYLLDLFRPKYMIYSDTFKNECERLINKWRLKAKEEQYDIYQKKLINSVATQLFELRHKAYLEVILRG